MSWVVDKWRSLHTAAPWRAQSTDFWNDYDAVIATTEQGRGNRGNSYEVWTYGELIGNRESLEEAQDLVEEVYGPLRWQTVHLDPVKAVHYYFGPTDEFSDPVVIHVVDKLPSLG
jgi:hypothetical protein